MSTPQRVAALNLGMQTVTMSVFESSDSGGISLHSFGRTTLAADPAADASRAGQLKIALSELRTQLDWNGNTVACAVPSQSVFTRFVKIPKVAADKVDDMLLFEAQQNVPYPIEDVSWAYQVIPEFEEDKLGALLLATKIDQLEVTVSALRDCGLSPDLIDSAPVALYNAFRFNYPESDGCTLLIDIGARATNLLFIEGEQLFIRTLPVGGGSITAAMQKKFPERSFSELENFKQTEGFIPPPGTHTGFETPEGEEMVKIARTVMTRIHNEITRSITFYRTNQRGSAPTRVYLAGGGACLPYTLEFFNEKLSLPVEFFNPFLRVAISPAVDADELSKAAHCLGECTGIALQELSNECPLQIELKSPSLEAARIDRQRRPFLIAAAVLFLATILLLGLHYNGATQLVRERNAELAGRIADLAVFKKDLDRVSGEQKTLMKESADLAAAPMLRTVWANLISDLNTRLPSRDIWITKLRTNELADAGTTRKGEESAKSKGGVTALILDGLYLENDKGPALVDEFVEALSQSAIFEVTPENRAEVIQLRSTQTGKDWAYDYQLILPLKNPIPL